MDEAHAQKLITQFKLAPKKRISALSKGMASMLTIVLALASRAPITFMDEPVAGLDVVAREDFTACCWTITPRPGARSLSPPTFWRKPRTCLRRCSS